MLEELVLYYNPRTRARIAHWMLEEVGAPYRIELVRFDRREHKSERFLAINPMGKVPALAHRGVIVTEAAAICAYLADAFPVSGLAPATDDPQRGTYYRWLFFAAACLEPAFLDKQLGRRPAPEHVGRVGYGSYEQTLATVEHALAAGPYLLGERFTAADVYLSTQIAWIAAQKDFAPRPAFDAYLARIKQRPAFQRHVARGAEYSAQLPPAAPQ